MLITFTPNTLQNISFFFIEMLQSKRKFLKHLFFIPLGSMTILPPLGWIYFNHYFHRKSFFLAREKITKIHREGMKVRYECRTRYEGKVSMICRDILDDDLVAFSPHLQRVSSPPITPSLNRSMLSQPDQRRGLVHEDIFYFVFFFQHSI